MSFVRNILRARFSNFKISPTGEFSTPLMNKYKYPSLNSSLIQHKSFSLTSQSSSPSSAAAAASASGSFPPRHFQDAHNLPEPYHALTPVLKSSTSYPLVSTKNVNTATGSAIANLLRPNTNTNINPFNFSSKQDTITLTDLFNLKSTRKAMYQLGFLMLLANFITMYCFMVLYNENSILKDQLVETVYNYDQKDISQTVMAIHIGLLKKQLLERGAIPAPSQTAVETSRRILSLERNDNGQLLIFVSQKHPIYPFVPFHSEYNVEGKINE
ncbi:hypothetical protein B5S28_g3932 [[Candida] boidinii]|uniref:Unnamed protein product n=1 Tax=Candida boidinii TaxID=5477 RepID=A0ACB5TYZ0_CANBO|nr:hypothetical protein B5S28_g3932 [[Candida] boidinii]OWB61316.1 hypothetical protein B5S29_g2205 [[Candida] boidinii]OWB74780.1 hypothetical protein B5S31_g4603 [[Candida] boidinii]GME97568.1 unnamed protein product [[Candida] boidinii]GME98103.1 unnamed protein product [[Candida] boidinii]